MPRNGSGTFTLVSGNPVVTGTTIESNWANTTLSDIATTLTDSLSRSGQGGMTAALRVADGTQGAPGVGFANETGSGFYRAGTGEVWAVVQGAQTLNLDANGVYVPADKTTTVDGAFVFNEAGADKDARFEGDTDANLLFTDASTDRVGIGTATPAVKLDVVGAAAISGNLAVDTNTLFVDATSNSVGVGTTTPAVSLDVNGGISIQSANNLTWGGAYGATTPAISASAGFLSFYPNGSTSGEQMRLTSTGLGIGTSSPSDILTLAGGASGSYGLTINNAKVGGGTKAIFQYDATNQIALVGGNTTNGLAFQTLTSGSLTTKATLDSSGNLGLGVTPSAWRSASKALQIGQGASFWANTANPYAFMSSNAFLNSSSQDIYIVNGHATTYTQQTGQHIWFTAPSGTAGNAISFTQAMTLDASGRLLVGTTTATDRRLSISTNATSVVQEVLAPSTDSATICFADVNTSTAINQRLGSIGNNLGFWTGATERARITSGGDLYVGTSSAISVGGANGAHCFSTATASNWASVFQQTNASPLGVAIRYASDANGISNEFLYCVGNTTLRASIRSNGGLANYSANDVNLSDRREKTNFAPAKSYLDTICAIPVQTFNYIDQSPDDPGLTLGVVAQDVQAVAPELVMESNWGTEDNPKMRLSIYQTDLQYALMKCVQELKAQNDELRARVAALEAKP